MSFGHSMSRTSRRKPVQYRIGEKVVRERWYKKRIGWFGYAVLSSMVAIFGLFSAQARDMFLQVAGAQLNNINPAELQVKDVAQRLNFNTPPPATNIIEVQSLMADWSKTHGPMKWGMVIKSVEGPQIDGAIQPTATFESRAMYKIYLAGALYNQVPIEKQQKSIKVAGSNVTLASCIERMIKDDDRECTTALGNFLDTKKAAEFLKKAGATRTTLSPDKRTAQTTAADSAAFFDGVDGPLLSDKAKKMLLKHLAAQPASQQLSVSCPGCTTTGVSDYGLGRLEAVGVVKYSKGSYLFVIYANGGTKDLISQFSGKLQQHIVETTTPSVRIP